MDPSPLRDKPASTTPDRVIGGVTILTAKNGGKYPYGNALVVAGRDETVLVDPSLTVFERGGAGVGIDRVLISHAHEDHLPGLQFYQDQPVHVHEADLVGVQSLDGLMAVYGYTGELAVNWGQQLVEEFHISGRPDAVTFTDGDRFDLGGRTMTVVHLPGHTRGHCGFLIEPDGVFYVADVDLTGFGPYYGDAWSDLESFEWSIQRCREIDARYFATFHQKGVIEGRAEFLQLLDSFGDVIRRREDALLAFLSEPHDLAEMIAHRFIYRPHVVAMFIDEVERRSAELHVARLVADGRVHSLEGGHFVAAS